MAIANITNNILTDSGIATSSLVPYTGATTDVNLGFNNFDANQINGFKIVAKLDGTSSGSLILRTGTSGYSYGGDSISLISSPTSANTLTIVSDVSSVTKIAQISLGSLTATRTFTLPDTSGTLALTSNLSAYLPLSGGTLTGALGGTSASFSSSVTATAFIPTGSTIPTNGMYRSAANTLNFATNSANRFTIASDGVATFGTDLYVNRNIYVNDAESGVYSDFYGRNSTSTSTPLAFLYGSAGTVTWNNGGTKMTLTSAGALQLVSSLSATSATFSSSVTAASAGIGTSPIGAFKLSIQGDDSFPALRLRNTTTRYRSDFNVANSGELGINCYDDTAATYMPIKIEGSKISILQGNVGIGTSSPAYLLDLWSTSATLRIRNITAPATGGTSSLLFEGINNFSGVSQSFINSIQAGNSGSTQLVFGTSGTSDATATERMRITSGGNVGIGTSSPIADTLLPLQINAGASSQAYFASNNNGGYGLLMGYDNANGYARIRNVSNTALTFETNNSEKVRITSGGNVGIGTSSPTTPLYVVGPMKSETGLYFNNTGANGAFVWQEANTPLRFATNDTERMRITSDGRFMVRTTSVLIPGGVGSVSNMLNPDDNGLWALGVQNNATTNSFGRGIGVRFNTVWNNGSNEFLYCADSANSRFYVMSNGGVYNYSANNSNISDERTKKDILPLESYWNKFKNIEIVKFKYKDQTHDDFNIGVIAQQVEKVAPEFVNSDGFGSQEYIPEDGIPLKSIYEADLHHATIKVLQEAMAKIETLETELTELKALIAAK